MIFLLWFARVFTEVVVCTRYVPVQIRGTLVLFLSPSPKSPTPLSLGFGTGVHRQVPAGRRGRRREPGGFCSTVSHIPWWNLALAWGGRLWTNWCQRWAQLMPFILAMEYMDTLRIRTGRSFGCLRVVSHRGMGTPLRYGERFRSCRAKNAPHSSLLDLSFRELQWL